MLLSLEPAVLLCDSACKLLSNASLIHKEKRLGPIPTREECVVSTTSKDSGGPCKCALCERAFTAEGS